MGVGTIHRLADPIGVKGKNGSSVASAANPLPSEVQNFPSTYPLTAAQVADLKVVSVSSSALPSGAATASKQDTHTTELQAIKDRIGATTTPGAGTSNKHLENLVAKDYATQTTLELARARLESLDGKDYATQTTLALMLTQSRFNDVFGNVGAAPAANTVLERLKQIQADGDAIQTKQDAQQTALDAIKVASEAIQASTAIMDDWDEADRAKVNLIAGQAGITAGAGAVGASTPRVTLASDDPLVAKAATQTTLLALKNRADLLLAKTDFEARINSLGQKTAAQSTPVTLPSDHNVATAAKQDTQATKQDQTTSAVDNARTTIVAELQDIEALLGKDDAGRLAVSAHNPLADDVENALLWSAGSEISLGSGQDGSLSFENPSGSGKLAVILTFGAMHSVEDSLDVVFLENPTITGGTVLTPFNHHFGDATSSSMTITAGQGIVSGGTVLDAHVRSSRDNDYSFAGAIFLVPPGVTLALQLQAPGGLAGGTDLSTNLSYKEVTL